MHAHTIVIVGLGLMGGSFAKSIKQHYPNSTIIGFDNNPATGKMALNDGMISRIVSEPNELNGQGDLCIVCVPSNLINTTINNFSPHLAGDAIITDISSYKKGIGHGLNLKEKQLFISGHPMAGSEDRGYAASSETLLENAPYFIIENNYDRTKELDDFLRSLGFRTLIVSQQRHDDLVAKTSHIPYIQALLTEETIDSDGDVNLIKSSFGPGFRDTTRVAGSNPHWGRLVCEHNREPILKGLKKIHTALDQLITNLENEEFDALEQFFKQKKELDDRLKNRKI